MITLRPAARGLRLCFALAMLIGLLASGEAASADARSSSKASTDVRRAAKACAVAKRKTASRTTQRTCSTLRAHIRRTSKPAKRPSKPSTQPSKPVETPSTPRTAPRPAPDAAPAPTPSGGPRSASPARLYSDTSPFNTRIGAAPRIAPNSAEMVDKSLSSYKASANFANSDWWGIAIVNARSSDPMRTVGVFDWGFGADIAQPAMRVPNGAAPTLGSDHHLAVLDGDRELDMWVADQQPNGSWMAGARTVTSSTGSGVSAEIGGNAAGFALAAGVIRPEEIAQGRIEHALQFTSPYVRNRFVAPAIHGDGRQSDPDAMPMGTRIQLDPAADISGLPRAQRIAAQALKEYGAYLTDSSGSLAIRGEASIGRASQGGPTDIWGPVGVTDPSMRSIPWDQMRVILP